MEVLTDGIDNDTQVYHCTQCRLYWFNIEDEKGKDEMVEYRLAVFSPIVPKDCPFCKGINKYPPTERFLDMQRVGRKEMTDEEYFAKYPEPEKK